MAAFDPSVLSNSGGYLVDGDINEEGRAPHAKSQVSFASSLRPACCCADASPTSLQETGEKLWALSEVIVQEKFVI